MPRRAHTLLLVLAGVLFLLTGVQGSVVQAETTVLTQAPCGTAGEDRYCRRFEKKGSFTLRSISLNASGPGSATVFFNGSGFCTSERSVRGAVNFESQIVSDLTTPPGAHNPGGAIFWFTVDPIALAPNSTHAFNLNSLRAFTIPGKGSSTFRLRVAVTKVDTGIFCEMYNASFTVHFTPK